MRILGIESSCDETAAAVVEDGRTILSNVIASQFDLHRPFGGVVPEVAARAHAERITAVIDEAMTLAKCTPDTIDGISVVNRPGLVGALLVGVAAAKSLALAWGKPLYGMDHIHGHVYSPALAGFNTFPHISLIVSGGHTCLYRVDDPLTITTLGQTADDAAGEAFDKVAKMLDLGFPGGTRRYRSSRTRLPLEGRGLFADFGRSALDAHSRPVDSLDFSYSGLKTAVYYHLRGTSRGRGPLRAISDDERIAVAASFQEAACEIMVSVTLKACRIHQIRSVAVAGGVACNRRLRELFKERAAIESPAVDVFFPPPVLCTDNAAMNAGLAYHRSLKGESDGFELDADPTPRRA